MLQHKPVKLTPPHQSLKKQQGVVIVVALFIVALVVSMAYVMMSRSARDTQRTSLLLREVRADAMAQGTIAWAIDQLHTDWEQQKPQQRIDAIPIRSAVSKEKGYVIAATIYDMQARFNLNNLINADAQKDFQRLLQLMAPTLSLSAVQAIVQATADWVMPAGLQAEYNQYYLTLSPPYQAAHRAMQSASEWQYVRGVTPMLFAALRPYLTALPAPTPVNVQTADAPVLAMLGATMRLEAAQAVVALRAKTPIMSTADFLHLDAVKDQRIATDKITVVSRYFLVETQVSIEKQRILIYTLLERVMKGSKIEVNVVWSSRDGDAS